jgi:hypothetical protein
MKVFVDTHDQRTSTLPPGITKEQFALFFSGYEQAAHEEGIVVLQAHVGLEVGRVYCVHRAPTAEHVRRAHEKAGLPFETITEVTTVEGKNPATV